MIKEGSTVPRKGHNQKREVLADEPFRLLTGFGIQNVGKAAAKSIMRQFGSIIHIYHTDS